MTANQPLILPFILQSENRKKPLTQEMEKAAIYCLSELEREKGGRLILNRQPEKTVFLTKIYYPLWLLPWSNIDLIFDALNTSKHNIRYKPVPDVEAFETDLKRSSGTMENYVNMLQNNANYFRAPSRENELALEGLLTDKEILDELSQYLNEAKQSQDLILDGVTLNPTLDEIALKASIEELDGLKLRLQQELEALASNMKLLNETTNKHIKILRNKTKATKDEYAGKIQKLEEKVAPKLAAIRELYDGQIAKLAQKFENQLTPIQKEKTKLEKMKERTTEKIERWLSDLFRHCLSPLFYCHQMV